MLLGSLAAQGCNAGEGCKQGKGYNTSCDDLDSPGSESQCLRASCEWKERCHAMRCEGRAQESCEALPYCFWKPNISTCQERTSGRPDCVAEGGACNAEAFCEFSPGCDGEGPDCEKLTEATCNQNPLCTWHRGTSYFDLGYLESSEQQELMACQYDEAGPLVGASQ